MPEIALLLGLFPPQCRLSAVLHATGVHYKDL